MTERLTGAPINGAEDRGPGAALEPFVSRTGGFQIGKPDSWHVKEGPADVLYEGFISRERLDRPNARFVVGMTVMRARDHGSVYGFTSRKPSVMAEQFAEGLAGLMGEPNKVTPMPSRLDKNLYEFKIRAGAGEDCREMWLVARPGSKEWFHALWEAPCDEAREQNLIGLMKDMAATLKLERKWGEK